MTSINNKKKNIKQTDEEIKETLVKLIKRSKEGIALIETIDNCYGVIGEASIDGSVSEEFLKEQEKRSQMKADLEKALNGYLRLYKEKFGEYKE